jgi:hypothetical protein
MGCCKNILRTWVIAANLLFALSGVIITYSAFTMKSPIDHIHSHDMNGVLGMGVITFLIGLIGMVSACRSDNGISRAVLCIYGTVLVLVCVASTVFGVTSLIFAGVMQGVEDGTYLNGTDAGNSTELAHFTEQTELALNMTWTACCTGEIPDFGSLDFVEKHHHNDDEDAGDDDEGDWEQDVEEDETPSNRLRGEDRSDFADEWREMSDEEKKEKIDEICTALTDALEKEGESLHCDDPTDGFNTFYHQTLQLVVKALGVYGIMMIMASCIQFITMLASCCLVCAGSDSSSSQGSNVNYITTHNVNVIDHRRAGGANSHYSAMRSPLVKEEVVTGNPVF